MKLKYYLAVLAVGSLGIAYAGQCAFRPKLVTAAAKPAALNKAAATPSSPALPSQLTSTNAKPPQPDKIISVSKSKPTFTLTLPANATTGYGWLLLHCNDQLITPVSAHYIAPTSELIGAPGHMQFQFKATAAALRVPRLLQLSLIYTRPWQPDLKAIRYTALVVTE